MPDSEGLSLLLAATIQNSRNFVVFTLERTASNNYKLHRQVVHSLTEEQKPYLSAYSVISSEQSVDSPVDGPSQYFESKSAALSLKLRSVTVINSGLAGLHAGSKVYFNILGPLLKEFGVNHVYVATDGPNSIATHATSFSSSSSVIFLGGDTSVHEFVNALPESKASGDYMPEMRLAVIPTGSGNALASSLGLGEPLSAVQRLFQIGNFQPLSSFNVDFPKGSYWKHANQTDPPSGIDEKLSYVALVVASWGFHSNLVADSEEPDLRGMGIERFAIAAKRNAEMEQRYIGTFEAGEAGPRLGPDHSYLLVTGVTNLEPAFRISPLGEPPASNKLFLVYLPALPGEKVMEVMMAVYDNSKHIDSPHVRYEQLPPQTPAVVNVADQDPKMRRWCVDGRIIVSSPGNVVLHPASHITRGWKLKILA